MARRNEFVERRAVPHPAKYWTGDVDLDTFDEQMMLAEQWRERILDSKIVNQSEPSGTKKYRQLLKRAATKWNMDEASYIRMVMSGHIAYTLEVPLELVLSEVNPPSSLKK